MSSDPRLSPGSWDPSAPARGHTRARLMALVAIPLAVVYLGWLLRPERIGNPALYAVLVVAEGFNLVQALGFWWTAWHDRGRRRAPPAPPGEVAVDVLIPVYDEGLDVVEPTVAAATRMAGARLRVALLDDKGRSELREMASRHGAHYHRREGSEGAKAGNLNAALARTSAPFVVVLDCDHVPDSALLAETLGHFADSRVALVQTPQYYANAAGAGGVAAAAWAQQALFFGVIARGKDALGAMFCCGTNVVFRRSALDEVGGFPEGSLTEDFELSVGLHEAGWRSVYVPKVLARGLGPEDMASYATQQDRWARGCLSAAPRVLRSALPWRVKAQYLLSASYFLSGWTSLVYMALPVVRIFTGAQPLARTSADQFLFHFAPYFGVALLSVAVAGAGAYTFSAFSLGFASFHIHVRASVRSLLRRRGRFVVTPKGGAQGVQLRPVMPALVAMAVLAVAAVWGLARETSPSMLNNVAFAALHLCVLGAGVRPALLPDAPAEAAPSGAARHQEARWANPAA
ncbi:MAG: glycosyltransferase family 2 protein [Actinomycetota bacterium]